MSDYKSLRPNLLDTRISEKEISHPIDFFKSWLEDAIEKKILQPNSMCLSTYSEQVGLSSRIVLLKEIKKGGFIFFTNYQSEKSRSIDGSEDVALNFLWIELNRQVRIKGKAFKISREKSVEYFNSRPEDSRIAAIASCQSEKLKSREDLELKFQEIKNLGDYSCPEHWGGFEVRPYFFEFWQGHQNRLHDRVCVELKNGTWEKFRKYP